MNRFRAAVLLSVAVLSGPTHAGESPSARIDLKQPGVKADGVIERSLFFASPERPVHLGPRGVGTFQPGASLTLPVQIPVAGRYQCVLTYALAGRPETITLAIDGQTPPNWNSIVLWPTMPNYAWGSRSLYRYTAGGGGRLDSPLTPWRHHRQEQLVAWVVEGQGVTLRPGRSELKITLHGSGLVLANVQLLPGQLPENTDRPWLMDGYAEFPGLDFQAREDATAGNRRRITFRGQWHNLAPGAVQYDIKTSVLPRRGQSSSRFKVVEVEPARILRLKAGQTLPFRLAVEVSGAVSPLDSEMVRLDLISRDVPNLSKPYLMCASPGYLPVNSTADFRYVVAYDAGRMAPAEGTNPRRVVPTRQTLGLDAGRYERNLSEAFVHALSEAEPAVVTRGGFKLTEWAKAGGDPKQGNFVKDAPLATVLSALGQGTPVDLHKRCLMLLADELPFYPSGRWDASECSILPRNWRERGGVPALASYVVLLRNGAMSDEEHFRFLHNVILPTYLCMRDDLRIGGVLGRAARAGESEVQIIRPVAPHLAPTDSLGAWLKIGTGTKTEYVRVSGSQSDGTVQLAGDFPGPLQFDHAEGTPWRSFQVAEWIELEALDLWSYLCAAVASRDSAVIEQCVEIIETIFATQHIFREDGSFALEPGSYGWGAYTYIEVLQMIEGLLGRECVQLPENLKQQMLQALIIWNDFPFSDGTHPMLNGGGARNQLGRLHYYGIDSDVRSLELLKRFAPELKDALAYYARIIDQEKKRQPGSQVENRSFKVDGWGYAMLRGAGPWDRRMETLLSSKHLNYAPGDHVSGDCLGICLFAHGAIMTPRYGYHWINDLDFFVNRARIDGKPEEQRRIWGEFLHFDPHRDVPSAVAYTEMCGRRSQQPGIARQERWCVQMSEYLFDGYLIRPRDGQQHQYELGFHHLGELSIATPADVSLRPALNPDGSPWEPFGYYRKNTGKEGQEFSTDAMWQADWTLNEGNIMFGPVGDGKAFGTDASCPPRGAKLRLSVAAVPSTNVVTAWLTGPGRNDGAQLRQDFLVVRRRGKDAAFVATMEPVGVGQQPLVQRVEVVASAPEQLCAARVSTRDGDDWFLFGGDFSPQTSERSVGPFATDASLAMLRVRDGRVVRGMLAGGRTLTFADGAVSFKYQADSAGIHHFDAQGANVPGAPPDFDLSIRDAGANIKTESPPSRPPPSASPHAVDRELQPQSNVGSAKAAPSRRVWTDSTGRFRVEAEFLRLDRGIATLRKSDGTVSSVPISRLSEADQEWLRSSRSQE